MCNKIDLVFMLNRLEGEGWKFGVGRERPRGGGGGEGERERERERETENVSNGMRVNGRVASSTLNSVYCRRRSCSNVLCPL